MDIRRYLDRIEVDSSLVEPGLENLKALQRAHLLNVPFENLDIHWGRRIVLDNESFYKKIVENGRGGFCYELNGNFNELLNGLGFKTKIVSARVANKMGSFGEDYDHLALVVLVDGVEYLADVGFGDFIAEPLRLEFDTEQRDRNGVYRLIQFEDDYICVQKQGKVWNSEYIFKNLERRLDEFSEMCVHNQTSPKSHFTQGIVCSLMTENGRKTLTDKKFIVTHGDQKQEFPVDSEDEFRLILKRDFGIEKN